MRIDHVAINVRDLERSRGFFVKYFGGMSNDMYFNHRTGLRTFFLTFEGGCKVEIMSRPGVLGSDESAESFGYAHLAFRVCDRMLVDSLTARLRDDGYPVHSGPRLTGDGYYESCVLDPDGNRIEIIA